MHHCVGSYQYLIENKANTIIYNKLIQAKLKYNELLDESSPNDKELIQILMIYLQQKN